MIRPVTADELRELVAARRSKYMEIESCIAAINTAILAEGRNLRTAIFVESPLGGMTEERCAEIRTLFWNAGFHVGYQIDPDNNNAARFWLTLRRKNNA